MTSTRAKAHNKRYLSGPILHRDMAPFYSAIDRLAAYSSVAIYGYCFFIARDETGTYEIKPEQIHEIIYSDLLFEFYNFAWIMLNYTVHAFKLSGFEQAELNELLKSEDVEQRYPYIAMLFLVGEKNADFAYEALQNEIRKKEIEGFDFDAMPSEDTRNICKEMEQANLIGDPTEFQVFNARFQQSSFSNPHLVDKIGNQIRESKLCRNLQARIKAVSGTRGDPGKSEVRNVMDKLFGPAEMFYDFNRRLSQIDDRSVASLFVAFTAERLEFFEMSPDAESWFMEDDPKHIGDLLNYQSATYLKIKAFQSAGNNIEASKSMILLHLTTGILHKSTNYSINESVSLMWLSIRTRMLPYLDEVIADYGYSDSEKLLREAFGWEPKALFPEI
jgi:hypothetical protein